MQSYLFILNKAQREGKHQDALTLPKSGARLVVASVNRLLYELNMHDGDGIDKEE